METLTHIDDTNKASSTGTPEKPIIPSTPICLQFWEDNDPYGPESFVSTIETYLAGDDDHDTQLNNVEDIDQQWLKTLESKIKGQISVVNDVGSYLFRIKESGLYRETHATFAAYCKDKFGLNHITDRPNTPAFVQVPRELANSIKAFINQDRESVRAIAYLITSFAKQSQEMQ